MHRIGHITPSSNTVVEPLTGELSRQLAGVSHHYTRIAVEAISLAPQHLRQFGPERMVAAAELLADAGVGAIVWNGTSGSWIGLDHDMRLCAELERATGVPASTSTLAMHEALRRGGCERIALAVPYTDDVTARIAARYADAGVEVVAAATLGMHVNREFASVTLEQLAALLRAADAPAAQAIVVACTGLAAAPLVEQLEAELGKPVIDSVAATLWRALELAGAASPLEGWGGLLAGELG